MRLKPPSTKSRAAIWNTIAAASILVLVATTVATAYSDELPRKAKTPREAYPETDVLYDSVLTPKGERLRTIVTKPHGVDRKLPVIFVVGWLSCDSIEAPPGTTEATSLVFQQLARMRQFCLFRVDKQGVGDSEGECSSTDFESELAGYRAAFGALKRYEFMDQERVYILGISNGGGIAPLVPESDADHARIRGYIVVGGWVKTWFEHMLEIERRRFALMGKSPGDVNDRMKGVATLYHDWLVGHRKVSDLLADHAGLADLWPEGKDQAHLYERPLAFYEQLQNLNLGAAWSHVRVPTLVLHGQYDWIMSRDDHELIAQYVNADRPGLSRFVELPGTGHTFQHYVSADDGFHGKDSKFDPNVTKILIDWLTQQQPTTAAR